MSTVQSRTEQISGHGQALHFAWLDPLRFFAALSVLLFHLHGVLKLPLPGGPLTWFRAGFLGVDLFFAISGAVIALSLQRLMQQAPKNWPRHFVRRRLARLLPLYLLTGLIFLVVVQPKILQRQDIGFVIATHALFIQNLFFATHGAINGPSWSLAVEMQFYLLMLLVGPYLLRRRWGVLLLLLAGTALVWRVGVWLWAQHVPPEVSGPRMFMLILQLPGTLDGFAAGIVAMMWRQCHSEEQVARLFPYLILAALAAWALALALLLRYAELYWSGVSMLLGLRALIALAAGLSVATVLSIPAHVSPGRLGRLLGDLSYGIYMWHMLALLWWQGWQPQMAVFPLAGLVVLSTLLLALASWFALERPILHWVRR